MTIVDRCRHVLSILALGFLGLVSATRDGYCKGDTGATLNNRQPPQIRTMRAHLFHEGEDGKIDSEDLFSGAVATWNVGNHSNIILVLVEFEDGAVGHGTIGALELRARSGKRLVTAQRVPINSFIVEAGHHLTVPFLVYRTGCDPMDVTARVTGSGPRSRPFTAKVQFVCGE